MTGSKKTYNQRAIYELLLAAFTPQELRRFCRLYPDFEPILADFGDKYSLKEMADEVMEYCRTQERWETLLAGIKEYNAYQYAEFEERLIDWVTERPAVPMLPPEAPQPLSKVDAAEQARWLDSLYTEALSVFFTEQWDRAIKILSEIVSLDESYNDAPAKLEEAQRQKKLADLYAEAVRLLRVGQYQAALDKWDEVLAREPQYPDRDKVQTTARQKLAAPAKVTLPKHEPAGPVSQAARPRQAALPGWFWPVAGGAAVLLAVVLVVIVALDGTGGGTPTAAQPPAVADTGDTWTRPADNMMMVYVPAGEFLMGSTDADDQANSGEKPQHTVYLDAFWIDRTEVTNAQFRKCVEAGACQAPTTCDWGGPTYDDEDKSDHPVVCVAWDQAQAYCQWAGARLPTEAEWEKATRGTDGQLFPWGDDFDGTKVNFCDRNCDDYYWKDSDADDGYARTAPVGSYPAGASPYGALDMAGNVWEWVADWYDADYYANSPKQNPPGPDSGPNKVLRGGSWGYYWPDARAANRNYSDPTDRYDNGGFRCVGVSPGG